MNVITHKNNILTPRQTEVVKWISLGKSNHDISRILSCSEHTVANHCNSIFKRLDAVSRAHAVAKAIFKGIISLQMLFVALILSTPENIEMRRGERRLVRRRNVIYVTHHHKIVGSIYHIPRTWSSLNLDYGENTV